MSETIKFRKYQKKVLRAQQRFLKDRRNFRALVFMAVGSGKTEIFIDAIIRKFEKQPNCRILIAHPRIALSQNQQHRFQERLAGTGVEFTSFHSGQAKYHTLPDRKNIATTDRQKLADIIAEASGHHITFSSYDSLHKIADMDWDLVICDEAHVMVQPGLCQSLHLFQPKVKVLFYTGTPVRVACQEASMDNAELFGRTIATVPPKALIPNRYIVPPKVRALYVLSGEKGNTEDYVTTIAHAFKDQLQFAHPDYAHKMLVAMPNTKYFSDIAYEVGEMRAICGVPEMDIYYVTASVAVKNANRVMDREKLIDDFASNPNRSIILHCDTLAEGIDVDGIGGVLIMRDLGKVKTIQTMGRGCRPAREDIVRKGKAKGEIRRNRIKTSCIVTIPCFNGNWGADANLGRYAEIFAEAGYGSDDFWADVEFQNPVGIPEDLGIAQQVEYKEAIAVEARSGLDERFWKIFSELADRQAILDGIETAAV